MFLDSLATLIGIVGGSLGIASFFRRETAEIWLDQPQMYWGYHDSQYAGKQEDPYIKLRASNVGDSNALRVTLESNHGIVRFTHGMSYHGRDMSDIPIIRPGETYDISIQAPIETWADLKLEISWTRVPAGGPFSRKKRTKKIEGIFGRPTISFETDDSPAKTFSARTLPELEAILRARGYEASIQKHS